jgi:hypothetical protein
MIWAITMATLKHRIEQLETAFLPRQRRQVQDIRELSNVELSLDLLDGFDGLLNDPAIADTRIKILAKKWLEDETVSDPLEQFAAYLLRTVIWGGHQEWMTGPIEGAMPIQAEQYRAMFPERVFAAALKPPPWREVAKLRSTPLAGPPVTGLGAVP